MNAPRRHTSAVLRLFLTLCAGFALAAFPRELLSMRPPAETSATAAPASPVVDFPFPQSLAQPPATAPGGQSHVLRLPVQANAVRLAVDKNAHHPLDHPLAVRREGRLPGRTQARRQVRVYAVNEPTPARPETQAADPRVAVEAPPQAAVARPGVSTRPPAPGMASVQPVPAPREVAVQSASRMAPPTPSPGDPAKAAGLALSGSRLLVVGDSLSISLADVLERRLTKTPELAFARLGKVSSGLARPGFFDWEKHLAEMVRTNRPDTVVVMIGANDNKSLPLPSGKTAAFGTAAWNVEYRRRAARLVEIARASNPEVRIVWLGAPVMADPGLFRDMPVINAALAEEMRRLPGCRFVDVWPVLAGPGGRYAEFLDPGTRLRAPDGVHLAPAGAARLADVCLAALAEPARVMLSQNP
jgi:hypothetical protein